MQEYRGERVRELLIFYSLFPIAYCLSFPLCNCAAQLSSQGPASALRLILEPEPETCT